MPGFRLAAVAVALLLGLLVYQIPARVVATLLPPEVRLEGLDGSLWHGRAARAQVLTGGKSFRLGALDWQLQPLSLLTLSPALAFESQWGGQRFAGTLRSHLDGRVELSDFDASVDVGFVREIAPLYIGGRLSAEIENLAWHQTAVTALQGRLVWQDAVWTARTGDVALGNYAADLKTVGQDIEGQVLTLSGPLGVEGTVGLAGRDYRIDLALTGSATRNPGLRDSLALLAAPSAEGFDMVLEGQL